MLIIITTHPIQYQVPLWQALARDGRVPFEVWYLTHHAVTASHDAEFGKSFAWDLDMLSGYSHRTLPVAPGATPASFQQCRLVKPLEPLLRHVGARAVWIQGWQVLAYWQAAWAAKRESCEVWLRAESNDLAPVAWWKWPLKRIALYQLFRRVDRFLYIGNANKRLYLKFDAPESRLYYAPYAVDNERFAAQAAALRRDRAALRRKWEIAEDAYCPLFCGKFIPKKRPLDLVEAVSRAAACAPNIHILFAGSGELGDALRRSCHVTYDADGNGSAGQASAHLPRASFAGFLNQSEVSQAYVAADCLVLPSDYGETWGLVVNEAMASGLPCIISDRCGCAEDLGTIASNHVFQFGDTKSLAKKLLQAKQSRLECTPEQKALRGYSFARTVQSIFEAYNGYFSVDGLDRL